jgi:hypothetical protein
LINPKRASSKAKTFKGLPEEQSRSSLPELTFSANFF